MLMFIFNPEITASLIQTIQDAAVVYLCMSLIIISKISLGNDGVWQVFLSTPSIPF